MSGYTDKQIDEGKTVARARSVGLRGILCRCQGVLELQTAEDQADDLLGAPFFVTGRTQAPGDLRECGLVELEGNLHLASKLFRDSFQAGFPHMSLGVERLIGTAGREQQQAHGQKSPPVSPSRHHFLIHTKELRKAFSAPFLR